MFSLFTVFLGGAIGASLRYLISIYAGTFGLSYQGTFIINILGCLFIGIISYIAIRMEEKFNTDLKLFLTTGIAGGFTTFSAFSYEVFSLFQSNQVITGLSYLFASLFSGLFATIIGIVIARYSMDYIYARTTSQEKNLIEDEEIILSSEPEKELYKAAVKD